MQPNHHTARDVPSIREEAAMRGRWLVAWVLAAATVMAGGPATAGGSWFTPEDPYQGIGATILIRETFGSGAYEGSVSDGPYFAYLIGANQRFDRPGAVPPAAVPLGPITIRPATGNYCCWIASLRFTVPQVPTGQYLVTYCNDPCTVDGLGDLEGTSFWIGETADDARISARLHELDLKREAARRQISRLEEKLTDERVSGDELRAHVQEMEVRLKRLRTALAAERADAVPTQERPVPPWAVMMGVLVLLLGTGLRRRLGRLAVPDVVPDELIREVEAQVPSRQPMTSRGRPAMSMPAPPLTKS
jgi:hypothetical protein